MKKILRPILCGGVLTALLCTPSLAAEQGDFSLLVNGEPVTFTDAAPVLKDGRSFLPAVTTFQALGFAQEDIVWDGATSTVIIDDVDAILAENTETYERMDQYLDYARKYSQGNYQVEGSYLLTSAPGEMESGAEIIHTVGGGYSMVTNQTAMQFAMDMSIGGTILGAPIAPTDMNLDVRADLDTGMLYLYFQSEDLEQLMNNNVQVNGESVEFQIPDQWYSLDMKAVYDEAYGPGFYEELIALSTASQEAAFAQTLEELLKSDTLILTSTATTSDYLEALNQLLGDSHFQKSGSTYTSTLEQDGVTILFHLYTSGGQVNGYGMEMTASETTGMEMTMTMEMKGDDMSLLMEMAGMTMEMDGTYRPSSTAPETEPPAGATVVDLWELLTTPVSEL